MTKSISVTLALLVGVAIGATLPVSRAQTSEIGERTVWYFYRVKWGHQDEFVELFKKNHYPVLKAQMGSRLVGFTAYAPLHHGDGRADWTFATELVFNNDAEFMKPTPEEIVPRLYPDLDAFQEEERRRFEILDAHWDIPLQEVPME
jgi:hypothetical protein